jgi:toxin ParE1/3/4
MGRPGRVPGTRELVVTDTPYAVAYIANADRVVVLAVPHGARTWPRSFTEP